MTADFLEPIPIEEADPVDRLMLADGDDHERPELDLAVYRDLVKDLPPPTDQQISAFAEYVSTAKSWYKHLPLSPPGRCFRFFIRTPAFPACCSPNKDGPRTSRRWSRRCSGCAV